MFVAYFDSSCESFEISPKGTPLACYEVPGGTREVVAFAEEDGVSLHDRRLGEEARGLFIDRGMFWSGSLEGLVVEYIRHAERIGAPPCSQAGFASIVNPPEVDGKGRAVQCPRLASSSERGSGFEIFLRHRAPVRVQAEDLRQAERYALEVFGFGEVARVAAVGSEGAIAGEAG